MEKQINPLTLTFIDPYLEREYLLQKLKYDVFLLNLISLLGLIINVIYCIYEFSDYENMFSTWKWLRPFYLVPLCGVTFLITRLKFIPKGRLLLTVLSVLLFSSIMISVFLFAKLNLASQDNFLTNWVIILFAIGLFSGMHFKSLLFFLTALTISITLLSFRYMDLSQEFRINMIIQITVTFFMALAGCYLQESLHRENFTNHRKIQLSRKRLVEKTRAIQEENLFKNTLLSIVAHDFRGPLSRLKGTIDLATKNYLTLNEIEFYLKKLSAEFHTVNLMSERVLNWVKGQMKGSRINMESFDFNTLIEANFQLYFSQSKEKSIALLNDVPQNFIMISDLNIINTVIRNLISNAIKFSNEGGKITISSSLKDSTYFIICSNTGIFLDQEVLKKSGSTFEFSRGTKNEIGFGMGIKMCNDLLRYLNSKLDIKSPENGLTIVVFELPTTHRS